MVASLKHVSSHSVQRTDDKQSWNGAGGLGAYTKECGVLSV